MLKNDIINILEKELKLNSNIKIRLNQFLECINDDDGIEDVLNWLQEI